VGLFGAKSCLIHLLLRLISLLLLLPHPAYSTSGSWGRTSITFGGRRQTQWFLVMSFSSWTSSKPTCSTEDLHHTGHKQWIAYLWIFLLLLVQIVPTFAFWLLGYFSQRLEGSMIWRMEIWSGNWELHSQLVSLWEKYFDSMCQLIFPQCWMIEKESMLGFQKECLQQLALLVIPTQ
jgi:hypothetical protein